MLSSRALRNQRKSSSHSRQPVSFGRFVKNREISIIQFSPGDGNALTHGTRDHSSRCCAGRRIPALR